MASELHRCCLSVDGRAVWSLSGCGQDRTGCSSSSGSMELSAGHVFAANFQRENSECFTPHHHLPHNSFILTSISPSIPPFSSHIIRSASQRQATYPIILAVLDTRAHASIPRFTFVSTSSKRSIRSFKVPPCRPQRGLVHLQPPT